MKICFRRRTGFSLLELVCVLAITLILMGIALPSVQSVRESARNIQCRNNLRQIVIAAQGFDASHKQLPAGTLGFDRVIKIANEISEPDPSIGWYNPSSPEYWKEAQHTSSLVLLSPFLEQNLVTGQMPRIVTSLGTEYGEFRAENPSAPRWIGDIPEVKQALVTPVPLFLCPTDRLDSPETTALAVVTSQPVYVESVGRDGMFGEPLTDSLEIPAGTNYLACAGAHSGGLQPNPVLYPYRGYGSCRERISVLSVTDGSSNTIMYGENIGQIQKRERTLYFSWMFGGIIRGRGILPWKRDRLDTLPEYLLLGDLEYSYLAGFGSAHPSTVIVAMGDGSVRGINRLIDIESFYSLTGGYDGSVPNNVDAY